jgi:hypothetical protein
MMSSSLPPAAGQAVQGKSMALRREAAFTEDACFADCLEHVRAELPASGTEDTELPEPAPGDDQAEESANGVPLILMIAALPHRVSDAEHTAAAKPVEDGQTLPLMLANGQEPASGTHITAQAPAQPIAAIQINARAPDHPHERTPPLETPAIFLKEPGYSAGDQRVKTEPMFEATEEHHQHRSTEPETPNSSLSDNSAQGQDTAPALQILSQLGKVFSQPHPASASSIDQNIRPVEPAVTQTGELKALRIRLHPEELGDVEVILRRVGLEMKVTIAVSRSAAAEALSRDLGFLEDRLGTLLTSSIGQNVTITLQPLEPDLASGQSTYTGTDQFRSDAALSGGGGAGRDGRPAPEGRPASISMMRHNRNEEETLGQPSTGNGRVV